MTEAKAKEAFWILERKKDLEEMGHILYSFLDDKVDLTKEEDAERFVKFIMTLPSTKSGERTLQFIVRGFYNELLDGIRELKERLEIL